jgi:hypothetical protein
MNCPPKIINSIFTGFIVKVVEKLLFGGMNQDHPKNEINTIT